MMLRRELAVAAEGIIVRGIMMIKKYIVIFY